MAVTPTEVLIVATQFKGKWYPFGSDTPIPEPAIVSVFDGSDF